MADSMSVGAKPKVDIAKLKKLTAQEIIKQESKGEEVPAELITWAQQMAAIAKIPDNVTYEQVDGEAGIAALEKLGIPEEDLPQAENAQKPTETEEVDAVKDPEKAEETDQDETQFIAPPTGQAAEKPTEEEKAQDEALTLADSKVTTDPEEIRKRKARKGLE